MELLEISVPFFIALIILEYVVDHYRKKKFYRVNDTINNLSQGVMTQVTGVFIQALLLGWYVLLFENFRMQLWTGLPEITSNWIWWVVCFFFVDFLYYWYHRLSHEVKLLWASHVVHHQSEEYNLAVALRQGTFQVFFTFFFFLPLPIIGFPTEMFLICYVIGIIYQFWIHTRHIGKLGAFELVFNTPSHHRVHHGRNPKYIDRNHAGVFIIWDKLFGTFQIEEEEPVYGITKEIESWNPLHQTLMDYKEMAQDFFRTKKTKDKIKLLVKDPGWFPEEFREERLDEFGPVERKKYNPKISKTLTSYAVMQFLLAMALFQIAVDYCKLETTPILQAVSIVFFYVLTLTLIGGLFDRKKWAWKLELLRILTLVFVAVIVIISSPIDVRLLYFVGLIAVVFLPWIWSLKSECVK